jgi:hypothetical protein
VELRRDFINANDFDMVGSMLEEAKERWKKNTPEVITELIAEIEGKDFFREKKLETECEEREKIMNELRRMLAERPPQLTEEELEQIVAMAQPCDMVKMCEPWV